MTKQTEVDVEQLKHEMRLMRAAIEAIIEWKDMQEMRFANDVAIVEGDDVTTTAARNGKIKKSHR